MRGKVRPVEDFVALRNQLRPAFDGVDKGGPMNARGRLEVYEECDGARAKEYDGARAKEYRRNNSSPDRWIDTRSRFGRSRAGSVGPRSKVRVWSALPPSSSGATVRKSSSTRLSEIRAWLRPGPPSTTRDSTPRSASRTSKAFSRSTAPVESAGTLITSARVSSRSTTLSGASSESRIKTS